VCSGVFLKVWYNWLAGDNRGVSTYVCLGLSHSHICRETLSSKHFPTSPLFIFNFYRRHRYRLLPFPRLVHISRRTTLAKTVSFQIVAIIPARPSDPGGFWLRLEQASKQSIQAISLKAQLPLPGGLRQPIALYFSGPSQPFATALY
jgi:hypothetical protein